MRANRAEWEGGAIRACGAMGRVLVWSLGCSLAGSLVPPATAVAQESTSQRFLRTLDVNGDGLVSLHEWRSSRKLFVQYDRNRDAYLDGRELAADPAKDASPGKGEVPTREEQAARLPVSLGPLPQPIPDFLQQTCTVCHNVLRIQDAVKDAFGWRETVERMRAKEGAGFSSSQAERVVRYLDVLRDNLAEERVRYGSSDLRRDWAVILDAAPFERFDRDGTGRLSPAELSRLVLHQLDLNGDRDLTLGEFAVLPAEGPRAEAFRRSDRNGDGKVSVRELGVPESLLALADQDGDGQISVSEVPRLREGPYRLLVAPDGPTVLRLLDRDRDGVLSGREIGNGEEAVRLSDANRDGSLDSLEVENAVARGRGSLLSLFDLFLIRYDLNGDGRVEAAEFFGPAAVFRRCDRNGDGVISSKDTSMRLDLPAFDASALRWRRRP